MFKKTGRGIIKEIGHFAKKRIKKSSSNKKSTNEDIKEEEEDEELVLETDKTFDN